MRIYIPILLLIIFLPALASASNGIFTQPLPDTSKFKCKYCPEEIEVSNVVNTGIEIIANNGSKFSEYRGNEGGLATLSVDGQYQVIKEDQYFSMTATHAGTNNRQIEIESRKYGKYQFNIVFDQISRFQSDSNKTIYQGINTNTLTKPATATTTPIASTQDVVDAYGTGSQYDLSQNRDRFNVTFKKIFSSRWESRLNYQFEKKSGLKTFGAAFSGNYNAALSVILPEPIDYTTQLVNGSVGYYGSMMKFETGVKGSIFKNANSNTTWDNIYIKNSPNEPTQGQSAQAPDNQYYQVYALGLLRPFNWVFAKGQINAGQMKQDQTFLPYTVNDNLTASALPKTSLGGSVNTLTGNFRLSLKPMKSLHFYANASLDRKDNKTATTSYNYVKLDTTVNGTNSIRTNQPYGYRLYSASVATDFYYQKKSFINLGYKYQQKSRTFSEVGKTKNHYVWGKVKQRFSMNTMVSVKVESSKREASNFSLISQIQPAQNILMRKFYLADNTRQKVGFTASTFLLNKLSVDLSFDYAQNDYSKSVLGVTDATDISYGLDLSQILTESISVNGFIHGEIIESNQNGIDFNSQNWMVTNTDTFTTVGLGFDWKEFTDEIDLGTKLVMAISKGEIQPVRNNVSQTVFPELETKRTSLEVYGSYSMKENMSITARYILEKYTETDWHYDDVNATTVSRVLGTQQVSSDYLAHLFVVSLAYLF